MLGVRPSLYPTVLFYARNYLMTRDALSIVNGIVKWCELNGSKLARYGRCLQMTTGAILLLAGWFLGHQVWELLLVGEKTTGIIVDSVQYQVLPQRTTGHQSNWTANTPIVEFFVAGDRIRFKDRIGTANSVGVGASVLIFYDPKNPQVAIIDRGVWNWIPWFPFFCLGLFLLLNGLYGLCKLKTLTADKKISP